MIPIKKKNEPGNFNASVRMPGKLFLMSIPNPTDSQWKGKEFWQRALPEMRKKYKETCAYCACWIPYSTGNHSVDHFKPKATNPKLAYEWKNFRYVSARFNSRKGTKTIVDPFSMKFKWFVIDFSSFFIKPNSRKLNSRQLKLANDTITTLKLNYDDNLVKERQSYFDDYNNGYIDFNYLKRKAPFIAFELQRQKLK